MALKKTPTGASRKSLQKTPKKRGPRSLGRLREDLLQGDSSAATQLARKYFHFDQLKALQILIAALAPGQSARVLRAALGGVGLLGGQGSAAIPVIEKLLPTLEPELAMEAVRVLRHTKSRRAVPVLESLLETPDDELHTYAIKALVEITGDEAYKEQLRPGASRVTYWGEWPFDEPRYQSDSRY